ncbi:MAG: 2-C-methyl-D-erythritol 4-phosphate cytidylyltransferase [Succinivibrionaceae bacterium]
MLLDVVIPAAGIGRRMKSSLPKQYLKIGNQTILEHTINIFLHSPLISQIIVAIRPDDDIFQTLPIASSPKIVKVAGGDERVNSVLNGLHQSTSEWVLVHDAARPCLSHQDLSALIQGGLTDNGAILAMPVRDTMKKADNCLNILKTEERKGLFHALTPQLFKRELLIQAITQGIAQNLNITDESSAMEFMGYKPKIIEGRSDNIKVTQPDDLAMAEFILEKLGHEKC